MAQSYVGGGSRVAVTVYVNGSDGAVVPIHIPGANQIQTGSNAEGLTRIMAPGDVQLAVFATKNILGAVIDD